MAIVVGPDAEVESEAFGLGIAGMIEADVECGEGVGAVEVEAVGEAHLGTGGGESIAVFGGAVVVGVVVVENLGEECGIVLRMVVGGDAAAHHMADGVAARSRGGWELVVDWGMGMGLSGMVGAIGEIAWRVVVASVVVCHFGAGLVKNGIGVADGDGGGIEIGDLEVDGGLHVGGLILASGHGLIALKQGWRGIDEGYVEGLLVVAAAVVAEVDIVEMPMVAIAYEPCLGHIVE